ncbi:Sulfhydrogenase 2 subunit gamma [uncultured archaeon]|nr:Sulfhydrogenase 2 subunit gamma [uncultured archaeon]
MPAPYRPYILNEIGQETEDTRLFVFTPADGQPVPAFKAGQFFMIRITDVPGLKPPMRSYSAARAFTPDKVQFGIKLHTGFTIGLFGKKEGDKLEISGPYGFFTLAENSAPIVLLAAGIGVTPLLCMAEELAQQQDGRKLQVFYSNRHENDRPFHAQLAEFESQNPNMELVETLTGEDVPAGWPGEKGRISKELLDKHGVDFSASHFYFCGPKAFNDAMQAMLEGAGVAKERIHKENW